MTELIEIYNMTEIKPKTRARIIIKLGVCINYKYASNVTEPIVFELVTLLDPENAILKDKHYLAQAGELS